MYPKWEQGTVQTGDMSMHYWRSGGDKPPLVLAHGFSDNGMCWLPVAQALSEDYDVILPDARGHGLSSRHQIGEKVNRAEDLAGFIRTLGLVRPIVGGHSMGGVTAAKLGAMHPDLARALILEDPAWFDRPREPGSRWKKDDPWRVQLEQQSSRTLEEVMAGCRADHPTWSEIELRPWAESKQQLDLNVFTIQDDWADWREVARQIRAPTLLITAETAKMALITPETAKAAQEINPLIRVAHISGAGHNIRRENYASYMKAVRVFLRSL